MNDRSIPDLLEHLAILEARESFWAYRQFIHPKLVKGWWIREMAYELQRFYDDLVAGRRPKLVIEAPPQHGKSQMVVDFITWAAGHNPDLKVIYTSFSERLGVRANLMCQRIYESRAYRKIFPGTRMSDGTRNGTRNRELIEFIASTGYFRNTTVRGSITGESLDLGVIDDPIKGREEASSAAVRDKTWDWLTDDFLTRFSENAGLLAILTRWHIDDPIGRLKAQLGDAVRTVSYPAIATRNEKYRSVGEPLFPELKSLDFLLERKRTMAPANWEALYQQNPQVVGGEIIKGEWFGRYEKLPPLRYRVIFADTALKTAERNDYSVFELWGKGEDGKAYLIDLIRGKWEAPELERRAVDFWTKHSGPDLRGMFVEDKASGTGLIQGIKARYRLPIGGIERTKDKYTRLLDVLGYIASGYVMLPANASFVNDFILECEAFSANGSHLHDDQVDPMIDAINDMLASNNASALWERMI